MDDREILREHTVIGLLDVGVKKMKMNPSWSPTGKRKDAALGPGRRAQAVAGITGMSTTVVSPSSGYALWTVLVVCAAIGKVLECRTSWGSRISAPLLAMGAGMVLSTLRIIPASAPAYDMVWKGLMPVAVALCVMERDLRHITRSAGVALTAFWVGALATVIGTVVSYFLVGRSLGSNGWKIAACLCATYIGGTINYAATAQQFAGADLGIMTLIAAGISSLIAAISERKKESKNRNKKSVEQADNDGYGNTSTKVECFAGAEKLGGALMLIYFSVIGANAALGEALAGGWNLILMEGIILAIHLGIILLVGQMTGMPLRAVPKQLTIRQLAVAVYVEC
ncbi:hypothetical protein CBR_g2852 [Chara braunii]|uniref:Uncharacterized protein n=1 Tax=Chara braunii TaxID=69332 RepID=A0A388KE70_CHABU|nr:hypothetical protein CBR_g2852 [Chara braunii]|eukprot:GBG68306.1 hypothetical protein CBR_g2852 [Chara braunii]